MGLGLCLPDDLFPLLVYGFQVLFITGSDIFQFFLLLTDILPFAFPVTFIADDILHGLGRGCTKLSATGMWSGNDKPVLMVILERRELSPLKAIVAERDRDAIVIISDVTEAFGEGFKELGV